MQHDAGGLGKWQHHIRDAVVNTIATMCLQIIDIRLPSPLMLRQFPTLHLMTSNAPALAHAVQVTTQHH